MIKLFVLSLLFLCAPLWAQSSSVELTLTSPLIIQDGIEVEISSTPIHINNPCSHMALNPSSCSFDSNSGVMTVTYDLNITPLIPSGKKGVLNVDISSEVLTGFEQVRILRNGIPVLASMEFTDNTQYDYQIEFKIKISGGYVPQQPQASINFVLEEQLL